MSFSKYCHSISPRQAGKSNNVWGNPAVYSLVWFSLVVVLFFLDTLLAFLPTAFLWRILAPFTGYFRDFWTGPHCCKNHNKPQDVSERRLPAYQPGEPESGDHDSVTVVAQNGRYPFCAQCAPHIYLELTKSLILSCPGIERRKRNNPFP